MKTKKIIAVLISLIILLCAVGCESMKNEIKGIGAANRKANYTVTVWSGGQAVKTYQVKQSFVNTESETDGWFFFVDGKLIRVSGTVTIEEN